MKILYGVEAVNVDLHLGVCGQVSLKIVMITDTAKLYIFILIGVTLNFIQGYIDAGEEKLSCCYSREVFKQSR